ncbi:MAG: hypothetical protein A2284_10970 [Deltaproteobacteria bacterium RIFOXYA12_FULL_61_11]|nr:MAG: hypothetical protein A2284_10970 [Deltaproteobacteria bacterium RIFOXYA12_FULL_61_11]
MKLTPLDIRNHKTRKAYRGYACKEVDLFLDFVASEFERLTGELHELRDNYRHMEREHEALKQKERDLSQTLLYAKNLQEELRRNAEKEAELIVSQAELKADRIVEQANQRLSALLDEIHDLKAQHRRLHDDLRGTCESFLRVLSLSAKEQQGEDGVERKVAFLSAYHD